MNQPQDTTPLSRLDDDELHQRLLSMVKSEHRLDAEIIEHLLEVERRGLGCRRYRSTFDYCQRGLGMSEGQAGKRVMVARMVARFPEALEHLRSGDIHLSNMVLLSKHLTADNKADLLARARRLSRNDMEALLASSAPAATLPAPSIRKLPERRSTPIAVTAAAAPAPGPLFAMSPPGAAPPASSPAPSQRPAAQIRYQVQLIASSDLRDKIEKALDLSSHRNRGRDLAPIFSQALDLLIAQLEKERFGIGRKAKTRGAESRTSGRHIPFEVRREVYLRDQGRCTFVLENGERCGATSDLELHHEEPFAKDGPPIASNMTIHCHDHNQLRADQDFGRSFMQAKRAS